MPSVRSLLLLPAAIVSAVTLDCKKIRADEQDFNLAKLGGPKEVHWLQRKPPSISNTTFTIDICNKLVKPKGDSKLSCPVGTQVCGIERDYNSESKDGFLREVIPIAGEYALSDGRHLKPQFTRLKGSPSNEDAKREGLRAELHGGLWNKQEQKAVIEFLCDPGMEGTEGFEEQEAKMMDSDTYENMSKREDKKESDDDDDNEPLPDLDKGKALQFVSYETEKEIGVLRLEWKTKYACEGEAAKKPSEARKSASWGFFTWFLIVVFLLVATYIIFGSWLNYNRYGARGWDLIPHGDTIRDIPYIVKDWTSSITQGGSNRGGYSAV